MPDPVCVGFAPDPDDEPEPGEGLGSDAGTENDCPPVTEGLPPPEPPPFAGLGVEPAPVPVTVPELEPGELVVTDADPNNCSEENV